MLKSRKSTKKALKFYPRARGRTGGPTCVDLFAGAGGLAEGFRQAGWSIRAGNDIDSHAGETFRLNFPEASFYEGPVSALSPRKLLRDAGLKRGELDCLIGGPPCQSFSYNNHQRSATDVRARLFRTYLQTVRALYPKTLVMENVPGMLTIGNGRVVDEIRDELLALGYSCEIKILFCEDFGVPQTRRRAFVIASRVGSPSKLFPAGTHGPSSKPSEKANPFVHRWEKPKGKRIRSFETVWDAIGDLPRLKNGGGKLLAKHTRASTTALQRKLRGRAERVHNHMCHELAELMLRRMTHVSEGGNWTEIPRRLLPAGMRRARKSDHTKRYGRLRRSGLASTVLTKCDPHWGAYFHPTQDRTVSVREAARLQGFPDRFRFAGPHTSKHYEQVGNAVPVTVARAIGAAVASHVSDRMRALKRLGKAPSRRPPAIASQAALATPSRLRIWRRRSTAKSRLPHRRNYTFRGPGRRIKASRA
jgi:DNA (cytosine-5)-methyltransferase 1